MTEAPNAQAKMMQMITGYWVTQIVRGAAHISLAEYLADGAKTAAQVAAAKAIDPDACARFLRACAGLGIVRSADGRFASTDLLETLREGPNSLRGFVLSQAAPGHWLPWGRFLDALQSGQRQTLATLNAEIFDYYKVNTAEGANFTSAMSNLSQVVAAGVAETLDTSGSRLAVDVGGAAGAFLLAMMRKNPELEGVVFDMPTVIPAAAAAAREAGLADRLRVVGGDFLKEVPRGDLYVLKHILHDWNDEGCLTILRNCRKAAAPGARIAIIEQVVEADGNPFTSLMDLCMLVMLTGRERTFAEYQALLSAAGFGEAELIRTNTPLAIITTAAV